MMNSMNLHYSRITETDSQLVHHDESHQIERIILKNISLNPLCD